MGGSARSVTHPRQRRRRSGCKRKTPLKRKQRSRKFQTEPERVVCPPHFPPPGRRSSPPQFGQRSAFTPDSRSTSSVFQKTPQTAERAADVQVVEPPPVHQGGARQPSWSEHGTMLTCSALSEHLNQSQTGILHSHLPFSSKASAPPLSMLLNSAGADVIPEPF